MRFNFEGQLSQSSLTDTNGVGNEVEVNGNIYRWVKNAESSTTIAFGQAAFHTLSDGITLHQNVKLCATANLGYLGGVVVATSGIAAGSYGWIQTHGTNTSVSVSGATTGGTAIAAGDYLKGVNAAAHVVRDAVTQPAYKKLIQALTAVATTTTPAGAYLPCFISCR